MTDENFYQRNILLPIENVFYSSVEYLGILAAVAAFSSDERIPTKLRWGAGIFGGVLYVGGKLAESVRRQCSLSDSLTHLEDALKAAIAEEKKEK